MLGLGVMEDSGGNGNWEKGCLVFCNFCLRERERDREESAFLSWKLGLGFSPSLSLSLLFKSNQIKAK